MSLSIVAGTPILGTLNSFQKTCAPRKEPLPPIMIIPSIALFFKVWYAFCLPFFVMKAEDRADHTWRAIAPTMLESLGLPVPADMSPERLG